MTLKQIKPQAGIYAQQPAWLQYGIVALTVTAAVIATRYIPIIGERAVFLFFIFAIIQSAFWFGRSSGLFALILSLLAVNGLVLFPVWLVTPDSAATLNIGFILLAASIIHVFSFQWRLTLTLWQSHQDLAHAQTIGQIGSWRMNIRRNELHWSDENYSLFGISKATPLTYETFLSYVHPEDRDYVDRMWQAALSGAPYDIEHRIIVADQVKWLREKATLEFNPHGELLGGFGITLDVTELKRNEQLLAESQRRYAGIVDSAMDAIVIIDDNQHIVLFNSAAENMFVCTANEAIGTSLGRFIPPWFREIHDKHIQTFSSNQITNRKMGIVTGLRANGEKFPIEVSISQLDIDGKITYTAIIRDITERVQIELSMQEQLKLQDQLTKVAASVPGLICTFRLSPEGSASMPYASPNVESVYGFPLEIIQDDFSPIFANIHPADINHIQETIAVSARTLQPWQDTFRYNHPEKGERWIEGNSLPQREPDGGVLWHGYVQDITERKFAETALREREQELKLIMDATPALIAYLDLDFTYLRINSVYQNWFCIAPEQILGHAVLEIIGERAWNIVGPCLEKALTGERVKLDYQVPYGTGKPRWVQGTYIPDKDSSGNVKGIVVHVVDIEDRKRYEHKINELNLNLRYQIEQMQVIFETAPVGLAIAEDPTGINIQSNRFNEELLGLPTDSEPSQKNINPATYHVFQDGKEQCVAALPLQRALHGEIVNNQIMEIRRADGTTVTLLANAAPLLSEDQSIRGAVGVFQDITKLKQTELERYKYVSLADNSQEFIGMCDMNFIPFYVNAAGICLVGLDSLEQALQTPVQEFFFPEDQRFIIEEFFPRVLAEKRGEVEIRFRNFKTGAAIWMIYNVFYIQNDQGELVGLATVSRDITARKLAEIALFESQKENKFLADLILNSSQPLGIGYADGRLGLINPAFEALTGYTVKELQVMDWATTLTPPEWRDIEHEHLAELQRTGLPVRYEKEYLRKNGTLVPVDLLVHLVTDADANPQYYYAFVTDITERKLAENTLRASEQRMRLATETTGVGIWEWEISTNRIMWDAQMFRIYGITPTPDGFIDYNTWSSAVLPEDLPQQEAILKDTLRNGGHSAREFRIHRVHDQEYRHIQAVETVRSNAQGHVEWVVGTNLDITERKHAEEALYNAQARLALVIAEVKAGYWDWDLVTNSLYLSPEWNRQLGLDENESQLHWDQQADRLHPDDRILVASASSDFIAGRLPAYELEFRLRHKNGSYRWIHSRAALLRDQQNCPIRMLGINLDVTDYIQARELNQKRDQMEQTFRLYVASQTAAAFAHELNQPLTAISYYADVAQELLQSDNLKPQKLSEIMEKCSQQAQRAGGVIRQLLSILHKGETSSEPLDINNSIYEALNFVKVDGHLGTFKIELKLDSGLPPVLTNALQVQKVLINLLHNALDAMHESSKKSGTIIISTRSAEDNPAMVHIVVCDSGKGITDAAMLKTMFQPFQTSKANGLGMGLAISRALVEAHGGKMWATQNPGSGISVHFTLPCVL